MGAALSVVTQNRLLLDGHLKERSGVDQEIDRTKIVDRWVAIPLPR